MYDLYTSGTRNIVGGKPGWVVYTGNCMVGMLQAAGSAVVYDQPKLLHVHKFLHEEVRGIVWEFYTINWEIFKL